MFSQLCGYSANNLGSLHVKQVTRWLKYYQDSGTRIPIGQVFRARAPKVRFGLNFEEGAREGAPFPLTPPNPEHEEENLGSEEKQKPRCRVEA